MSEDSDGAVELDVGSASDSAVPNVLDRALVSVDGFQVMINARRVEPNQDLDLGRFDQHERVPLQLEVMNVGSTVLTMSTEHGGGLLGIEQMDTQMVILPGQRLLLEFLLNTQRAGPVVSLPLLIRLTGEGIQVFQCTLSALIQPYIRDAAISNPRFKSALESILNESGLVGIAAAVVRGTEIIALEGAGFSDREQAIAVDPRVTRFRWASVAKSMGAVVALRSQSVLIDTSITDYFEAYQVPEVYLPPGCRQRDCALRMTTEERHITLRQLFSHRAGIQHYSNGVVNPTPPTRDINDPAVNDGIEWAIDYFASNPLIAKPGTRYAYSSFGYNLMGVVLEHALGDTYEHLVQTQIGETLGMQTLQADRFWQPIPNRAVGYRFSGGSVVRDSDTDVSWKLPGGGFISTIVDLARYCGGLQSDVLLSPMLRETVLFNDHFDQNYALGFGVGTSGGRRLISHTGAQQKAASSLRLYPDEGLCIVMMSNTRPDSSREGYDSAGAIGRRVDTVWRGLE